MHRVPIRYVMRFYVPYLNFPTIKGIVYTPAGKELARVVERIAVPEYTEAMLQDLDKQGWVVRPA